MAKNWICLIGHRSSGKTSLGMALAKGWGLDFFDQDRLLETQYKRSASELYLTLKEGLFRDYEEKVLFSLPLTPLILATGGGAVLNESVMRYLKKRSRVVYLKVTAEELKRRRLLSCNRPVLKGYNSLEEEIAGSFSKRDLMYQKMADIVLDTSFLDEGDTLNKLKDSLHE